MKGKEDTPEKQRIFGLTSPDSLVHSNHQDLLTF